MIPWFCAITFVHESKLSSSYLPSSHPDGAMCWDWLSLLQFDSSSSPNDCHRSQSIWKIQCFPGKCLLVQTQGKNIYIRNQNSLLRVTVSLILKLQSTLSTLRACRNPFPLTTTWNDSVEKKQTADYWSIGRQRIVTWTSDVCHVLAAEPGAHPLHPPQGGNQPPQFLLLSRRDIQRLMLLLVNDNQTQNVSSDNTGGITVHQK